jgi:hypothetical protein
LRTGRGLGLHLARYSLGQDGLGNVYWNLQGETNEHWAKAREVRKRKRHAEYLKWNRLDDTEYASRF